MIALKGLPSKGMLVAHFSSMKTCYSGVVIDVISDHEYSLLPFEGHRLLITTFVNDQIFQLDEVERVGWLMAGVLPSLCDKISEARQHPPYRYVK